VRCTSESTCRAISVTDIRQLTCPASLDAVQSALSRFGVARIPGFLDALETEIVLKEAQTATSSMANYRNPFGISTRFSLRDLPPHLSISRELTTGTHLTSLPQTFTTSRDILERPFFQTLTREYLGPKAGFMEVVAFARDHIPDPRAVYGQLHFDRRRQLKFIFYLNDVDASNGAFGCIPGSHRLGRALYLKGWRETLELATEHDHEIEQAADDTPEDQPEYRLVPCIIRDDADIGEFSPSKDRVAITGAAGTLVIFDTNLLHYGGFVRAPGKQRWTFKGHTFANKDAGYPRTPRT